MKRYNRSLPLAILVLCLMAGSVLAATTFVTPTSSTVVGGNYVVNITTTDILAPLNCTVSGSSAASGGTLSVILLNVTEDATFAQATLNTKNVRDASDWTLSATCMNGSRDTATATAVTGVKIDNTVPTITTFLKDGKTASNTTELDSSSFTFAGTVKNATSCSIHWKGVSTLYTSTSGYVRSCTLTPSSSYASSGTTVSCTLSGAGNSNDVVYLSCTDGLNTTTGAHYTAEVGGHSSVQAVSNKITEQSLLKPNNNNSKFAVILFVLVAAMILLVIAAYFATKKRR